MEKFDYEKQANDFLAKTNVSFKAEFLKNDKHFEDDKTNRDIYTITFKRGSRKYNVEFGQSILKSTKYKDTLNNNTFTPCGCGINNTKKVLDHKYFKDCCKIEKGIPPTAYDVLFCLQKYEVGSFKDFCAEFGYDEDSRKAEKIYHAVQKEFAGVCKIWSDEEIEELQKIQ